MKKFAFLLLLLTGCVSENLVQVGPDTYMVTRTSKAGMFTDRSSLKSGAIAWANNYAALQGKQAEVVSMNEKVPVVGGFPSFDYVFKLVPTNAPVGH